MDKTPRAFISHSHEDKERFVLEFAKRLRENGVNAWLDEWEMNVGDSIVEKIFSEGIKGCDYFIIILSKNSIASNWVRAELDSACVKRIEGNTKIMPLILDDVEVPDSLKHCLWKKVDPSDIKSVTDNVLKSIFGIYEKPGIGDRPQYTQTVAHVPELTKIDILVLKTLGELLCINGCLAGIRGNKLRETLSVKDISINELADQSRF